MGGHLLEMLARAAGRKAVAGAPDPCLEPQGMDSGSHSSALQEGRATVVRIMMGWLRGSSHAAAWIIINTPHCGFATS